MNNVFKDYENGAVFILMSLPTKFSSYYPLVQDLLSMETEIQARLGT
jgi:hypothetical protein